MTSPRPRRRRARAGGSPPSTPRPRPDLADVDRQRDHLDAPLLLDPPHRDRRVEPARVREHHSLGVHASPLLPPRYRARRARRAGAGDRARRRRSRRTRRAPCRHRRRCRARRGTRPGRARSRRRARSPAACAARRGCPSAPPRPRTRPSPAGDGRPAAPASFECSGIAYAIAPPGIRTLTAPSSSRSRLTVAWVATTPSASSSCTIWAWLETACSSSSRAMRCWRCGLPSVAISASSASRTRTAPAPRASGSRPAATRRSPGPSITSVADLFAPVRGQAVQEARVRPGAAISAASTCQPGERLAPDRRPRAPRPSTSTRRCRPRRRPSPLRTDRRRARSTPPRLRARSTTSSSSS